MKKLLIMASLFWPQKNSGGPPVSVMNLIKSIQDQFDIYIISNNHEINNKEKLSGVQEGWNQFSFGKAFYITAGEHRYQKVSGLIEEIKPDVIYQNSFFSINDLFPVLIYKKRHPLIKVIITPRGEFYPERYKKGYLKKNLYCRLFRYSGLLKDIYFQGTGETECRQEVKILGIQQNYIYNIQNLPMIITKQDEKPEKHSGELKLVYIARIHPTKNLLNAIKWLSGVQGLVFYDIYGSIEDTEYWLQCKEAITKLPSSISVRYKGLIDHEDVPKTLLQYHVFYMPTTGENFGHSIVEAMLASRPVIISDQTPWLDVNGHGGYAYSLTNDNDFIQAINELVEYPENKFNEISDEIYKFIIKRLNIKEITKQYIEMFNS